MPQTVIEWLAFLAPSRWDAISVAVFSSIVSVVQLFVGGFDTPIQALAVIVVVDYLTGTIAALKLRQWSSSVGFKGLAKKVSIFVLVGLCHWLDMAMSMEILRNGAICAYAVNEFGSVLENVDRLGYGDLIPASIRNRLSEIKERRKL